MKTHLIDLQQSYDPLDPILNLTQINHLKSDPYHLPVQPTTNTANTTNINTANTTAKSSRMDPNLASTVNAEATGLVPNAQQTAAIVGSHYKIGKKIGEGSFGIIYEGEYKLRIYVYEIYTKYKYEHSNNRGEFTQ